MTDQENHQQSEDIPDICHDSEGKQQQNRVAEVLITENGSFSENCTKKENETHTPSSSRERDLRNDDADRSRNIVSRMQNYSDMPTIACNAVVVNSEDVTVHRTPGNHEIGTASTSEERSTNHESQQKQCDDSQPGSSAGQLDSRQLESIDSTIYVEPEPEQEPIKVNTDYIEETWDQSKARRYRRRAIFCTDTYNNMADMAREQALSEALSNMKDRWNRRTKLDRKLSDLVLTNPPKFEARLSEQQESINNDTSKAKVNGDVSVEENDKQECKQRPKKLTMKDVYKELRLMKQVVAACVRTDPSVVSEPQDKSVPKTSPSDVEKNKENVDSETETATEKTVDRCDNDEAVPPSSDMDTIQTKDNNETNIETQDSTSSQEQETETATEKTVDRCDNDEAVPPSSDMDTIQTEDNNETNIETQDSTSSQEQKAITTVRGLSDMDGDKQDSDEDCGDKMTTGQSDDSCANMENEQKVNLEDAAFSFDKNVHDLDLIKENEVVVGSEQREGTESIESCDISTERSVEQTLQINNHNDVRDKVPSRVSVHIDETPDEETYSRKDSVSSMDWASTYSNMADVVVLVDDYNGESVVGCVVYTDTDRPDPARCTLVYPADVPAVVNIYENVVSNILHIVPEEIQDGDEDDDEVTIAIPFVKDEMHYYQEPVLRVLDVHERWSEYPCRETLYHQDDDTNLFVLMAKFTGPTTCVVVAIPIVDDIVFTNKMTRFHSTVDREIILTCPVSARINAKNVHVELKVLPVLPSILEKTKVTFDTDRQKLYNAGAIVTLKFFDDQPQTIYMHLPCTRPPVPSRPMTGSRRVSSCLGTPDSGYRSSSRGGPMSRKGSTFGKFVEPSQEKEYHLVRFASCMATKVKTLSSDDVTVDDQAIFSVHEKSSTSIVLEVTEELPPKVIQDIVPRLLTTIEYQNVQICLAHNKKCLNKLALSCDRATNVNSRQMMRLENDNIVTTRAVQLREGDTLCLCFRGNVSSISNHRTIFRYYGLHGIHTAWTIDIVDRFCQRSLSSFRGFLQIFVWKAKQPFDCHRTDVDNKTFWNIVTEMPISLPKTVLKLSTKVVRAPVTLRTEGTITPEFLDSLALAIGEGWLQLANCLDIDHPRIQSIKQQHKGKHQELARDILMTWFKRSLFVKEKTSALIMALRKSGRDDLADTLRDSSKRYRREQARNARDNKMEIVILSVCKSSHVVSRWKDIASMLDMNESEIQTINAENPDDVSKCRGMLSLWKQKQNGYGTRKLVKCLRHLGLDHIADHLTSMMTKTPS